MCSGFIVLIFLDYFLWPSMMWQGKSTRVKLTHPTRNKQHHVSEEYYQISLSHSLSLIHAEKILHFWYRKSHFFPYPNITFPSERREAKKKERERKEENMKTLKKWLRRNERRRNQWKDLNKKHDVSSFDSIVYTQGMGHKSTQKRRRKRHNLSIPWFVSIMYVSAGRATGW